jgi:hypothetical protein
MSASSHQVRDLLHRLRTATGGTLAAFVQTDRRVLAIDSDAGVDLDRWQDVLRVVEERWDKWRTFERTDGFTLHERTVIACWLAPHGVLLVELASNVSLGLARLRMKSLLAELERAIEGHEPDEGSNGSSGSSGRPLH